MTSLAPNGRPPTSRPIEHRLTIGELKTPDGNVMELITKAEKKRLNRNMKDDNLAAINSFFHELSDETLPILSSGRVRKGEWGFDTDLFKNIKYGQVVLFAHVTAPLRVLGIVTPSEYKKAKGVVRELQFDIIKLEFCPCKKPDATRRLRANKSVDDFGHSKGIKVMTTRRGFYFMHMATLQLNIVATKGADGEWQLPPEHDLYLVNLYTTYVHGMERRIDPDFKRNPLNHGLEQFLLQTDPTPAWRETVLFPPRSDNGKLTRRQKKNSSARSMSGGTATETSTHPSNSKQRAHKHHKSRHRRRHHKHHHHHHKHRESKSGEYGADFEEIVRQWRPELVEADRKRD